MTIGTIIKSKIASRIITTSSFYIVSFIIIAILEKQGPSGACAPGLGMMAFFLLIPVSAVLFLISLYKSAEQDRTYLYSAMVHILVWTGIYLYL